MDHVFVVRLVRNRDFYAGGLMVIVGTIATVIAPSYGLGTMMRIGPGFFPTMLGVALIIIGVMIIVAGMLPKSKIEADEDDILSALPKRMEWRGWSCLLAGPIMFALLGEHFGLIPAAFSCVFVSAMGDRKATVLESLVLAGAVSVFGGLLFSYLIRIPLPMLAWRL